MAFTVVPDKSSGDPVTLAMWDSIKDNLNKGVMRPIATTEVTGSPAASIVFSGIAADWLDLLVVGSSPSGTASLVRLNGDSGLNYYRQEFVAAGAGFGVSASNTTAAVAGQHPWVLIPNYTSTAMHKCIVAGGIPAANNYDVSRSAAVWANTAAVTSVTLVQNAGTWDVGTRMTLYGIAGV